MRGFIMLIRFSCQNFRSIGKDPITLEMISSTEERKLSDHICKSSNSPKILRNAVIYGANASGKSNIIKAIKFLCDSVKNGRVSSINSNDFCRSGEGLSNSESIFEMQLEVEGRIFDYGFGCLLNSSQITSEWLYELKKSSVVLFERNKDHKITIGDSLETEVSKSDNERLKIYKEDFEITSKENSSLLFLSFLNQVKSFSKRSKLSVFKKVFNWFVSNINVVDFKDTIGAEFYSESSTLDEVADVLASFDTGINKLVKKEISVEQLNEMIPSFLINNIKKDLDEAVREKNRIRTVIILRNNNNFICVEKIGTDDPAVTVLSIKHEGSIFDFEYGDESDGTKRLFDFLDMFFTKSRNTVFIVDELNRSLHPMLTKHLVELFNAKHSNDDCQLIFTTHENDIMSLDLFLREEIWFVERNNQGCSKLFSLNKFDEIQSDTRLSKQYLMGRYGGIPILPLIITENNEYEEE